MIRLIEALKRKYRTPADALRAIGLPASLLDPGIRAHDEAYRVKLADPPGLIYAYDSINSLRVPAVSAATLGEGKVARPMRARRFGRDEEMDREALKEMLDDPNSDFGDILAAVIENAPEDKQQEVYEAMRELSTDARGPRSWARDRMECRRYGRDQPPKFEGRPTTGTEGEDRRRMAGDSAYNSSPHAEFERLFGSGASSIERG